MWRYLPTTDLYNCNSAYGSTDGLKRCASSRGIL